jgi:hypothetical protein
MLNVTYHEWYSQSRFLLSWLAHHSISVADYFKEVSDILESAVLRSNSLSVVYIPLDMTPERVGKELAKHVL